MWPLCASDDDLDVGPRWNMRGASRSWRGTQDFQFRAEEERTPDGKWVGEGKCLALPPFFIRVTGNSLWNLVTGPYFSFLHRILDSLSLSLSLSPHGNFFFHQGILLHVFYPPPTHTHWTVSKEKCLKWSFIWNTLYIPSRWWVFSGRLSRIIFNFNELWLGIKRLFSHNKYSIIN